MPIIAAVVGFIMSSFGRIMASRLGMWIVSALGFLGLSIATQTIAIEPMMQHVQSSMGGISGDIAAWLGVIKADRYVSIVISAYAVGNLKRAFLTRRAGA